MSYSILEAQPLEWETFKRGSQGWATIVCQLALDTHYKTWPLRLDGVFGPETERIAKEVQVACHVTADGIIGPATQEAFLRAKCKHAELHVSPAGLLIGVVDKESTYQWACTSKVNEDGSEDYGGTQVNLKPWERTEAALLGAYNPDASAHVLAGETSGYHKAFLSHVGDRRAWELAALAHNWPAASWALAVPTAANMAWLEKPFSFAPNYATGMDYCNAYIQTATEQVTSWVVT